MRRISPARPAAIALMLAVSSCGIPAPTSPESSNGALSAPVIARAQCGVTMKWPDAPLTLAWQAVNRASTYTVEVDCENCGNAPVVWFSQSGSPWHIRSGLSALQYVTDVVAMLRREGGRTLRWRVWAVDALGRDGSRADWCVIGFSETGLQTPGTPNP
jgi:hypothetical protein